jgi:hypothetical protein
MIAQKPTREPVEAPGREPGAYRESHPAYAVMGASRVTSTPGAILFGSDFRHQSYIVVRIAGATLTRDLSHDWVHSSGRHTYIEVALSEAQWATFLSTLNVGDGVPATVQWRDGPVSAIAPMEDRRAQFNEEIDARLADTLATLREALDAAPTKAQKAKIAKAIQEIEANLPWVAQQFDKHAEETVERMKIEVSAYITGAINRAGLKALGAAPLLELVEGES